MKSKICFVLVLVCLTGTIRVLAQSGSPIVLDAVVADVGGRRVTMDDVMESVRDELNMRGITGLDASVAAKGMYASALTNLVDRQLILLKYEKIGKKLPEWYLNQRVEKIIEEKFGGDRSKLVDMLNTHGISYEKWRSKIKEDTVIMTMRQQFVNQKVIIKPEEIQAEYDRSYKTKKLSGPVRVSMIQLRPEGKTGQQLISDAKSLVAKLRDGDDFSITAMEKSCEQHAEKGGDWGYVNPVDEFRGEIADAIGKLKVGEVSEPVVIGEKLVYILKKTDERSDLSMPLDFVYNEIESGLKESYAAARYRAWIDSIAKDFTVRIYSKP